MTRIRILLADDHKLVRQGVRALLEAQPQFEVVGEASDGQEALKLIQSLSPDIAFLDVMMPNLNGIDAAKLARQRALKTKIIFLTMHANAAYAVRALQSGALGYILKDSGFNEILQAIECAMEGRRYLSESIADDTLEMLIKADPQRGESLDALSPREREILQLIAEGNRNSVIAEKLSLSVRTVESHRLNLMKKLHITSQANLVKFAISQGLTSTQ